MDGFFDWKGWGWAGWGALGVIVSVLVAIWPKKGGEASSGAAPSAGFGLRDYQEGLERREAGLREDLERAHGAERDLLRHQREEVARKLADVEGAYQAMLAELEEARAALKRASGDGTGGGAPQGGGAEAGRQALLRAKDAITPALEAAHKRGAVDENHRVLWSDPQVRADFDAAYDREPENVDYLYGAALIANGLDDESGAERLYRRVLAQAGKLQDRGEVWPDFFTAGDALADLLRERGASAEAEALYLRMLAAQERALGPESPALASRLNTLAVMSQGRGALAEAEALYRRAIALREKEEGPEGNGLEQMLENLAGLLQRQERYPEAEALYRRCLAITAKDGGEDSYAHASNLNALGNLLYETDRDAAAETLYRRTVGVVTEVFGPESPELRPYLENLAGALEAQGEKGEAEALRRRAAALPEA